MYVTILVIFFLSKNIIHRYLQLLKYIVIYKYDNMQIILIQLTVLIITIYLNILI